jgi:uncharacterized protein (TIGR02449 family)
LETSNQGTPAKDGSYQYKLRSLESKLDALLAYTQALENTKRQLTGETRAWQKHCELLHKQQLATRERLERVIAHLKSIEALPLV